VSPAQERTLSTAPRRAVASRTTRPCRRDRGDLELRLDERNDRLAGWGTPRLRARAQDEGERDERDVDHGEIAGLGDEREIERADVVRSRTTTPRILADRPGELAVADVDRIDRAAPRWSSTSAEAAGRGPDIEGGRTARIDRELSRPFASLSAPRETYVMVLGAERDVRRPVSTSVPGWSAAGRAEDGAAMIRRRRSSRAGREPRSSTSLSSVRAPSDQD